MCLLSQRQVTKVSSLSKVARALKVISKARGKELAKIVDEVYDEHDSNWCFDDPKAMSPCQKCVDKRAN